MAKVQIQELAPSLMEKGAVSRTDSEKIVTEMFNIIGEGLLRDGIVKIKGFGTFKIVDVEPRESVNVNTGVRQLIQGHNKISFTPDSTMKELVNKPFSLFETVILNEGVSFDDEAMMQDSVADALNEEMEEESAVVEESPVALVSSQNPEPVESEPVELKSEPVALESEPEEPEPVEEKELEIEPAQAEEAEMEPAQEEEAEPVIELDLVPESEIEPEPVALSSDSVPEEMPEAKENPEEESVEPLEEESVAESDSDILDVVDEDEESEGRWRWLKWACGVILLLLLMGGIYYYKTTMSADANQSTAVATQDTKPVQQVSPADSLDANSSDSTTVANRQESQEEKNARAEHDRIVKDAETYQQIDKRLKSGAYYIVGLDFETKAKKGENVRKIANRVFGKGMECYICAYNNLSSDTKPLEAGQKILVPKLVLKSKVRKMVE